MAGGVEYQVTKVDPTDPETKGMVHQVHKVSEEIAATIGGKVYRARIINDPTAPTVAGKVYQIVLIDDPDDPSVKGMVYNAILTGGSEAVVVGPAVSPLSLPDAVAGDLDYVKAFGGTEQNGTPTPDTPVDIVSNNGALKATRPSGLPAGYTALEYLQSDGASYLIVPYRVNNKTVFYCRYNEIQEGPQVASVIFGVTSSPTVSQANYGIVRLLNGTSNFNRMGWGDSTVGSVIDVNAPQNLDTWYEVLYDQNKLYQDNVLYATSATPNNTEWTANYDLGVFARSGASVTMPAVAKISSVWAKEDGEYKINLVPAKNSSGDVGMYDLVSGQFFTNQGTGDFVAGPNAIDPITLTVVGTTETIATKANGEIISSATAEMLLSVGDYTDEQEIISGVVTRNVGIKVFDGTETFIKPADGYAFQLVDTLGQTSGAGLCTHFKRSPASGFYVQFGASGNKYVYFRGTNTDYPTQADFKQWLADQYAAGTPVIVIYPLATPTTESVTGQTLQVQDGDNTLEITQASIDDLELEARYDAAVTLAVQETEDANLDDNVTVTIE